MAAAKKAVKPVETKRISIKDFVVAYRDAKTLAGLGKKLESLTNEVWDEQKISTKISALRNRGIILKTLIQRGWTERKTRESTAKEDINALLSGSDAMASKDEMPKSRK